MTKKQKAAAKSAAASRRYRAKLREKMAAVRLRGSSALVANAARVVKKREIVKDTGDADQVLFHMGVVHDMINKATEQAADRVAARFGEKQHPPQTDMTASDVERYHGEGGKAVPPAAAKQAGVMTVLLNHLDLLVERARNIRNRQGEALITSFGRREAVPVDATNPNTGAGAAQGAPAKADIIGLYLRNLDSVITELDAQSRLITEALD
jgi:hypothetical protein